MEQKRIINLDELAFQDRPAAMGTPPEKYEAKMAWVGPLVGAEKLGYSVVKLPPGGNRAFPFHNHRVNEELFIILEGTGTLRLGSSEHPVRKGDFIACPPGNADTAHQLVNTGDTELSYIGVSTKISPEIADYPQSGTNKFGILSDDGFRFIGHADQPAGYWEGEE